MNSTADAIVATTTLITGRDELPAKSGIYSAFIKTIYVCFYLCFILLFCIFIICILWYIFNNVKEISFFWKQPNIQF